MNRLNERMGDICEWVNELCALVTDANGKAILQRENNERLKQYRRYQFSKKGRNRR